MALSTQPPPRLLSWPVWLLVLAVWPFAGLGVGATFGEALLEGIDTVSLVAVCMVLAAAFTATTILSRGGKLVLALGLGTLSAALTAAWIFPLIYGYLITACTLGDCPLQ